MTDYIVLPSHAGVDEAGRGCLVGSVFAAAVMLPAHYDLRGLTDSKKLSEAKRDALAAQIKAVAAEAVVKGDAKIAAISAASILAKTARDAEMYALHERHPEYGFAQHKGYGTAAHLAALQRYGALLEHRADFAPVKQVLAQGRLFG